MGNGTRRCGLPKLVSKVDIWGAIDSLKRLTAVTCCDSDAPLTADDGPQDGRVMIRNASKLTRLLGIANVLWVLAVAGITTSQAAALRVEPVLVEVFAPGAASTLTLRNDDNSEVTIQIRVFKWSQANGKEMLEPTADVVASPPAVKLAPRTDYVARIVRTTKQPIQVEESYRILVDQLPRTQGKLPHQVNLLIRQSIPVFFDPRQDMQAAVTWSLAYDGPRLVVTAQNSGQRRLRISALTLRDDAGRTISFGGGLVGYVLSHSAMSWIAPGQAHGFGAKGSIVVSAQGDTGPIHVEVRAPVGR